MTTEVWPSFEDPPMPVLIAEGKTSSISEKLVNGSYNDYNISSDDIMMPKLIAEGTISKFIENTTLSINVGMGQSSTENKRKGNKPSKRKRKLSFKADVKNKNEEGGKKPHLKKKKNPRTSKSNLPNNHSICDVKPNKRQKANPGPVEQYFLPLKEGWVREVVSRYISDFSRNDIYYHPPHGKKLRSRVEIGKFLAAEGIKHLTVENFTYFNSPLGYGEPFEICRGAQIRVAVDKKEPKGADSPKKAMKSSPPVKIKKKKKKGDNLETDIRPRLPNVMIALKKPKKASKKAKKAKQAKQAKPKKVYVKQKKVEESSDEEHQVVTEIAMDDDQVGSIYTSENSYVECKVEEEDLDKIIGVETQQEFCPLLQENCSDFSNQNGIGVSHATGGEVNHSLSHLHSEHCSTTQNGSPKRPSLGLGNCNSSSLVQESRDQLLHIHMKRESSSQKPKSPITGDQAYKRDTLSSMKEERRNGESSFKPVEFCHTNSALNDKQCKSTNTATDRVTDSNSCLDIKKNKKKKLKKKKERDNDVLFVETGIVKTIKQEKEEEGNVFFPVISSVKSGPELELELDDSLQIPLKLWYDASYESKKREEKPAVEMFPQMERSNSDKVCTQKKSYSAVGKLTNNLASIKIHRSSNKTEVLLPQGPKTVTKTNSPLPVIPPRFAEVPVLKRQIVQGMNNFHSASSKPTYPSQELSSWHANQVKNTQNNVIPPVVSQKKKVPTDTSHIPASSPSTCSTKTSSVQFSAANQMPKTPERKMYVSVPEQLPLVLALSTL